MEEFTFSFPSTKTKRKGNEKRFTYSWYLPAPPTSEENAGSLPAQLVDQAEVAAAGQEGAFRLLVNVSRSMLRFAESFRLQVNLSPSMLRFAGLSGWSVASGVGVMALLVIQSPVPVDRVLALGGVWAAVSALIWFLPGRLIK